MRRFFSKKSSNTKDPPPRKPAPKSKTVESVKRSLPKQPSAQKQETSATNASSYDSISAASHSSSGGSAIPFSGILNNRARPLQHYERTVIESTARSAPCHPLDDSFAAADPLSAEKGLFIVSGVKMTLPYTVIVSGSADKAEPVRNIIDSVFESIHSSVNGWSETSEISKLNNYTSRKPMKISATLDRVFQVVDKLYEITDGRFDPTTGILKLAFLEAYAEKGAPPEPNKHYKRAMGWKKCIARDKLTATRLNANTLIDFDGLSKGFCIDLIVESLVTEGYKNIYVDWAGDIRAVGQHPSGRPWRTALMAPPELPRLFEHWKKQSLSEMLDESDIGYTVSFDDTREMAMASSGDYFQIKKYGYHHIMRADDMSAMKASARSVGAVSVLAASCALADGLATAAMTLDTPKEAAAFLRDLMKRIPDKIFGFCIIGRGSTLNDSSLCTTQFTPTESNKSARADAHALANSDPLPVVSVEDLKLVRECIADVPGRLTWSGGSADVDSFTSCSMEPDPKVSFLLPLELEKSLPATGGDSPEQLQLAFLGGDGSEAVYDSLQMLLVVTNLFLLHDEGAVLVIARVDEIRHGGGKAMMAILGGTPRRISLHDSFVLGDFKILKLEDQAKKLYSELPASVAVIAATSSDGSTYGLTATSVKISKHAAGLVSFNLMHTSTFFKAFGGKGSDVAVHCLSDDHEELSKAFTSNATIDKEGKKALAAGSFCIIKGVVNIVHTVEDHAIVIASIEKCVLPSEGSAPLLWHRRRMTNFRN